MRVSLNLGMFFHDHRSFAKIFVNQKMKCIKDVHNHISNIFKIQEFYLKCDNQYLPPDENVQILQNDDVVWVVPSTLPSTFQETQELMPEIEEVTPIPKKKKKKKQCDIHIDKRPEDEEAMQEDLPQKPSKKKKKRGKILAESPLTSEDNITKRRKVKSSALEPEILKDSGRDSLGSRSDDSDIKNISVQEIVQNFENKKPFTPTPKPPEKRINIVKTIIVSNKPKETEEVKRARNEVENAAPETSQSEDCLETSSPSCSIITEMDCNVNKRKRKRTRKRKSRGEISTTFEQPVYNFIHKPLIVQNPNHMRFDEESDRVSAEFSPNKDNNKEATEKHHKGENENLKENNSAENNETIKNESVKENHNSITEIKKVTSDVIEIESDTSIRESVNFKKPIKTNFEDSLEVINLENYSHDKKVMEESIAKHPCMLNLEPKVGDVVAFKMLRMSENYTPEMSSSIVGKVAGYNRESKDISLEIIYGHEQCAWPNGKFSLDPEESDEVNTTFSCSWSNLLEPKLIFP